MMNYSYLNGFICRENNDTAIPYKFLESQILTQPQLDSSFIHLSCQGSRNHASDATKVSTYINVPEGNKRPWLSAPNIDGFLILSLQSILWSEILNDTAPYNLGYGSALVTPKLLWHWLAPRKSIPGNNAPMISSFAGPMGPMPGPQSLSCLVITKKNDSLHSSISFLWNQFGPVYPPLMFIWWLWREYPILSTGSRPHFPTNTLSCCGFHPVNLPFQANIIESYWSLIGSMSHHIPMKVVFIILV